MSNYSPPTWEAASVIAAVFLSVSLMFGFTVRSVLRSPTVPRTLSIFLIVAISNLGAALVRYAISQYMYHTGLREGSWVYVWLAIWTCGYCGAALMGGKKLPALEIPGDHFAPPEATALVREQRREADMTKRAP